MGVVDMATLLVVATGITKVVDLIRTRFDKAGRAPKDLWIALAIAIGVAFALSTKANLLADIDWAASVGVVAGRITTGVALGGAASGSHELLDFLSGAAKNQQVQVRIAESKNQIIDDPEGGAPILDD